MPDIFSLIKSVSTKKPPVKELLSSEPDFVEREFQPYIFQRWLSMVDDLHAYTLNNYLNKFRNFFDNKPQVLSFIDVLVPKKNKSPYIKYLKKEKKSPEKQDEIVSQLAKVKQISKREARNLLELEKWINEKQ